jgi:hypothetical protein
VAKSPVKAATEIGVIESAGMDRAKSALEKLQRIQDLWIVLERTRPNTPEYEKLVKQIHALSSEYQTKEQCMRIELPDSLSRAP